MNRQHESPHSAEHQQGSLSQSSDFSLTRDQLLTQVLSETLARHQEDPESLLDWLRRWRATQLDAPLCLTVCEQLVQQVLNYRMGDAAEQLPALLRREVGAVLWNDPESRRRIDRLWQSLRTCFKKGSDPF